MGNKSKKKYSEHDGINKKVALMMGVSANYVSQVRSGRRTGPRTERILSAVMEVLEGEKSLLAEVKKVVDLENTTPRRTPKQLGDLI